MHKFALSVAVVSRVSDTHHGPGDADHGPGSYHAIAFVNVGLASPALRGISKEFDLARISDMVAATMVSADVLGIGFCGVGGAFEGLPHTAADAFLELLYADLRRPVLQSTGRSHKCSSRQTPAWSWRFAEMSKS